MRTFERSAIANNFEKDGEYISLTYTQEDGQRVTAEYKRVGWRSPPTQLLEEAREAFKLGPCHIAGRRG